MLKFQIFLARLMPVFGKGGRNAAGGIPHDAAILALVMAAISEAPYSPSAISAAYWSLASHLNFKLAIDSLYDQT